MSGYKISKDSTDFGWPEGGIKVAARPVGDFQLEISGGDASYPLQELEEGAPFIARVYYQGELLSGEELAKVELKWQPETSNAEIKKTLQDDHYELRLHYKDPEAPEETVCGECTVSIYAFYTAEGSDEAQTECPLTYNIDEDLSLLQAEVDVPQDYIVISDLKESKEIVVNLKINGEELTIEQFKSTQLQVDCGGIQYEVTPNESDLTYRIKLQETDGIDGGDYPIQIKAFYTDAIGREAQTEGAASVTLGTMPMWMKWLIGLLAFLVLLTIILLILHIKVLPKNAHVTKKDSTMIFDGEDESKSTTFYTKMAKKNMVLHSKYAGTKTGVTMDVKPGKESYLRKPQGRRSAEVKSASVRKYGNATIQEVSIGSIKYLMNEETGKLERMPKNDKPFLLKHGTTISYSGTMLNAGVPKPFTVTTKLNFKKK